MRTDSFLQPEITGKQSGYRIDTDEGTWFLPIEVTEGWDPITTSGAEFFGAYLPGSATIGEIEEVHGYFGRLSAPGYLDCTDWTFDTNRRRLERSLRAEED